MRAMMRCSVLFGLLLLLVPRCADAQGAPGATPQPADQRLIAVGIALRKEGRDAEALAVFEQARTLRRTPRAVIQIALAQQALGRWREAEQGIVEGLREPDDPWIAEHRAYLDESLAAVRAHLATLEVESSVLGAEVWIGGVLAGHAPLDAPVRVAAGDVTVLLRAAGYAEVERTMHAEPGSSVHVVFVLSDRGSQPPYLAPGRPVDVAAPARPASGTRALGWIALAGAGGLAALGGAALLTRELEAQAYNNDAQCTPTATQSRADRCGTDRDIGTAAQTIGIAALAGAGVVGAVSAIVLWTGPRPSPSTHGASLPRLGCAMAGSGVVCRGVF